MNEKEIRCNICGKIIKGWEFVDKGRIENGYLIIDHICNDCYRKGGD